MANIKSSKKRAEIGKKQGEINSSLRSTMRNQIKKFNVAIESGDTNKEAILNDTISNISKMSQKGLVHKNTAARKISQVQRKFNLAK